MNIYDLPQENEYITFEVFHLASLQFTTFDHFLSLHLFLRLMPKIFDISI